MSRIGWTLALAILLSAAPAVAEGWYAGVTAGVASNDDFISANDDGSLSGLSSDDSDVSYQVNGGYDFNDNVSAEASYNDMGEQSFTATSAGGDSWEPGAVGTLFEADAWQVSVLGRWPIAPKWWLYGRVGASFWSTKETFTEPSGVSTQEDSGTDALYGAGVEYDIGQEDKFVWRAEYTMTDVDADGNGVGTAGFGLRYKF